MATATPSARALHFAASVIRDHGHHHAPDRVEIRLSQRELARRYDVSPGTIAWYLTELGDRVLARRPHLVLSTAVTDADVDPRHDGRPSAGNVADLLAQLVAVVEATAALMGAVVTEHRASGSRAFAPDSRESFARSDQERQEKDPLPGLSPLRSARERIAQPRDSFARSETLDQLLEPLEAIVGRHGLTPMSNRRRLHGALTEFSPEAVSAAVTRICTDIARGVPIRSPYGLLVHKAEQHDPDYFTVRPLNPPPAPVVEEAHVPDEADQLTDLALAAMDNDPARWANELEALEKAVGDEINATGTIVGRLAHCAPYRKAVRHDIYRRSLTVENTSG